MDQPTSCMLSQQAVSRQPYAQQPPWKAVSPLSRSFRNPLEATEIGGTPNHFKCYLALQRGTTCIQFVDDFHCTLNAVGTYPKHILTSFWNQPSECPSLIDFPISNQPSQQSSFDCEDAMEAATGLMLLNDDVKPPPWDHSTELSTTCGGQDITAPEHQNSLPSTTWLGSTLDLEVKPPLNSFIMDEDFGYPGLLNPNRIENAYPTPPQDSLPGLSSNALSKQPNFSMTQGPHSLPFNSFSTSFSSATESNFSSTTAAATPSSFGNMVDGNLEWQPVSAGVSQSSPTPTWQDLEVNSSFKFNDPRAVQAPQAPDVLKSHEQVTRGPFFRNCAYLSEPEDATAEQYLYLSAFPGQLNQPSTELPELPSQPFAFPYVDYDTDPRNVSLEQERLNASFERERRSVRDDFLVRSRRKGMTYKQIRQRGGFTEAESTLRGRYRALTKRKQDRVRRPVWKPQDISLLKEAVINSIGKDKAEFATCRDEVNALGISWKDVANYIANNGGSYHFGNSTCKKKWLEVYGLYG